MSKHTSNTIGLEKKQKICYDVLQINAGKLSQPINNSSSDNCHISQHNNYSQLSFLWAMQNMYQQTNMMFQDMEKKC